MDLSCYFCLVFVVLSCASVYWCLVVTCWERADLLALVCDVKLFPLVSLGQVWYLIVSIPVFALFLTLYQSESTTIQLVDIYYTFC